MKTSSLSALCVTLAALLAGPASAAAQDDEQEEQDARQEEQARQERIRTVTIRHGDGDVFVLGEQRGWLGVRVDDVDRAAADSLGLDEVRGARVLGVSEASPAAEAGLREDDVIVGFDGESVRSVAELVRLVRETPPGRRVELRVVRDGSSRSIQVTITEREGRGVSFRGGPGMRHFELHGMDDLPEGLSEERMERLRKRMERAGERREEVMEHVREHMGELDSLRDAGVFRFHIDDRPRLGVRLESLTDQLAEYFGVGDRGGVLISSVRDGSPAADAGLRAGDVVVAFGDEEISDVGDLVRAVHRAEAGPTTVTVVRDGEERSVTVEMPEATAGDDAMGYGGFWQWDADGRSWMPTDSAVVCEEGRCRHFGPSPPPPAPTAASVHGVRLLPPGPAPAPAPRVREVEPAPPAPAPRPAGPAERTIVL